MSPRLPPKIFKKHEWRRELVSNRTNQFSIQIVRETSRSQEIDVNCGHKEAVYSERTVRPVVETSVFQTRSYENRKDPHVETAHEKRGDSLLK